MALRVAQLITSLARGGAQATVLGSSLPGMCFPPGEGRRCEATPVIERVGALGPAFDRAEEPARGDGARGVEVTVLAGPDDPGEGTSWCEAADRGIQTVLVPSLHRSVGAGSDAIALWWLVRWLRENRPDVLHTHSAKAGLLGRLAASIVGTPALHTVHGWSASAMLDGPGAASRRRAIVEVERRLARRSQALVVVTSMDADEGLRRGIGTIDQYRLIRSGVDLDGPRRGARGREELRSKLGVGGRFVVGTVGRLADQKDLRTLIAGFASARIHDGRLVIIGDGPRRLDLKRQVATLGLTDQVRFLGHRDDASELVAAFDVFVSTSRWEGLPRTIIEAMAAGVPVIATPVGGICEVVDHGTTGWLVPVGDPGAVAECLQHRVRQPENARQMAAAASGLVDAFTTERMRADLVSLWHEVSGRAEPDLGSDRLRQTTAGARVG